MSTHLQHLVRTIRSLHADDKYVFVGAIILIVGLFLPWFSINLSDLLSDSSKMTNAFDGTTYIVGYLCYFFTLLALYTIDQKLTIAVSGLAFVLFLITFFADSAQSGPGVLTVFLFLLSNLGFIFALANLKFIKRTPKNTLNLFVGIENIILIFVASMIYHRESLGYTSANLNFGVYTAFAGAILLFYGGFAQMKNYKKTSAREAFSMPSEILHGGINLRPDLNIDKTSENQNNEPAKKENSQLSFGDYE